MKEESKVNKHQSTYGNLITIINRFNCMAKQKRKTPTGTSQISLSLSTSLQVNVGGGGGTHWPLTKLLRLF